jgi:hypothetical protein
MRTLSPARASRGSICRWWDDDPLRDTDRYLADDVARAKQAVLDGALSGDLAIF